MIRRVSLIAGLCALFAVLVGAGPAQAVPAQASPGRPAVVQPNSCQAASATLYLVDDYGKRTGYDCSGWYNAPTAWITTLIAGGWSGRAYEANGYYHLFCDWETLPLNTYIYNIYLSPTNLC